jgi:CheY-like chemotaxis protein
MRLKIVKPPTGDIPGISPANFLVGRTYDVGSQVSGILIAEGWAELVSGASDAAVLPSSEPTVAIRGVVLVIDDEPDVRRLTQTLLALNGYHVVAARPGKEGIELLQRHCPDLIVLDLNMPVMDGWQFRAEQRHLPPRLAAVPVVLVSGDEDALDGAGALKVDIVLKKPFEAEKLLDAVRRTLGR